MFGLALKKKNRRSMNTGISIFILKYYILKNFLQAGNKIGTRRSLLKQPDSFSYRSSAWILKCNWILLSQTFTSTLSSSLYLYLALFLFQYPSPVYTYLPFSNAVFPLNIRQKSYRAEPWMKEEKGIRHRGEGAYLCCRVFTTVHFSLRNEGSSEYILVCEGRESLRPNF